MSKWNFYIDRGGTFTDVVAEAPDGAVVDAEAVVRQRGL